MNPKPYLSEALGTLLLTLAVSGSISIGFGVPTPVVAGLTLGLGVYVLGSVSGAHLNPAISLMLWLQGKLSVKDTVGYIVGQFVGGGLAMLLAAKLYGGGPELAVEGDMMVLLAEIIGTFSLGLGVSAAANGKVSQGASGLTVGTSLLLGALLAGKVSNGVLNPAVAFGVGSCGLMYMVGPIIGAALAGTAYTYLIEPVKKSKKK